ncbi:hypothetical protein BH11VER1_BH11VER1_12170 [soil metagenome]
MIEQIISARQGSGEIINAFYFRTSDGLECDLLIESGNEREIIEIKLASTPSLEDFHKLEKIAKLVGATRQVLISRIDSDKTVMTGNRWSVNLPVYLSNFISQPDLSMMPLSRSVITVPILFKRLCDAAGAMRESGDIKDSTLIRRANWLKTDLDTIGFDAFNILPTVWIEPPGMGVRIPLVEYKFGETNHDTNHAKNPNKAPKNSAAIVGSKLDREDLLHFSKVSEIGHTLIPNLWLSDTRLRADVQRSRQHLDTLNEVWWLSRWKDIDEGSIKREYLARKDDANRSKQTPSTVDWRFTALSGKVSINLSVKNRVGTIGSRPLNKGVYLFGDEPDKPFDRSKDNEINVLAITAYHGGWITPKQEADLVTEYLDETLKKLARPVVDAVALSIKGGSEPVSYDRLYFPKTRELHKKDLILTALFKPMDMEDESLAGINLFPMSLPDAIENARRHT